MATKGTPSEPENDKLDVRLIHDLKLGKGEILRGFYPKNHMGHTGPETYPKMSKNASLSSENEAFKEDKPKWTNPEKKIVCWDFSISNINSYVSLY